MWKQLHSGTCLDLQSWRIQLRETQRNQRSLGEAPDRSVPQPGLQPLSGETIALRTANRQDEARLDIRAQGFWGERRQNTFFDVRV